LSGTRVLLVALTVHHQAVMTDDFVVALDDGIAKVAALRRARRRRAER